MSQVHLNPLELAFGINTASSQEIQAEQYTRLVEKEPEGQKL